MKPKKQDLQKLTETETKIKNLLTKKKITFEDIETLLNEKEVEVFEELIRKNINENVGVERDNFLEQVDEILPKDTKNQLWENNHYIIIQAISKHIEDYGKMPTKNQISNDTGLSRQTIHKHLKNYTDSPLYAEQLKQFKLMFDRVLAKVIKIAVQGEGNVKAARLYFDIMGYLGNQSGVNINTQNNYIQINQTKLSQETIKQLSPEQLNQIEAVLQTVSNAIPK